MLLGAKIQSIQSQNKWVKKLLLITSDNLLASHQFEIMKLSKTMVSCQSILHKDWGREVGVIASLPMG